MPDARVPLAGTSRYLRRYARNLASILRLLTRWLPVALIAVIVLTRGEVLPYLWRAVKWNGYYSLVVVGLVVGLLEWERVVRFFLFLLSRNQARIERVLVSRIAREIAMSCTITVDQLHKHVGLTHRTARELRAELLGATILTLDREDLSGRTFTGVEPFALVDADSGNRGVISPRVASLPLLDRLAYVENVLLSVSTRQPSKNVPLPAPADPDTLPGRQLVYTSAFMQEFLFRSAQLSRARLSAKPGSVKEPDAQPARVQVVDS